MNSDSIKILNDFQTSLVSFFDELIEMFPNEGDFVTIRIMIKDRIPITQIADYFAQNILPEKELIKARSDSVFLEKNVLFSSLGPMQSNNFKNLWASDKLDKQDRETIWKWLDVFLFLVEKYKRC